MLSTVLSDAHRPTHRYGGSRLTIDAEGSRPDEEQLAHAHGKARLFPSDISTIQQALIDIADNLTALLEWLETLESTVPRALRMRWRSYTRR